MYRGAEGGYTVFELLFVVTRRERHTGPTDGGIMEEDLAGATTITTTRRWLCPL